MRGSVFLASAFLALAPSCGGRVAAEDDTGSTLLDAMVTDEDSGIVHGGDGGVSDAPATDSSVADSSVVDSSVVDASTFDAGAALGDSSLPDSGAVDSSPPPDSGMAGDCPGTNSTQLGFSYDEGCDNFFQNTGRSNACTVGGSECSDPDAGILPAGYSSFCCFKPAIGSNCDLDYHVPQCIPR